MNNSFMDDKSYSEGVDTKINSDIDPQTQEMLNKPIIDPDGFTAEEMEFIQSVMQRVYAGEINLLSPSSLINENLYENSSDEAQGRADIHAINFCSKLRSIKDLMEISGGEQLFIEPTFQVKNLVQSIKFEKEQFEKEFGDMFVI